MTAPIQEYVLNDERVRAYLDYLQLSIQTFFDSLPPPWVPMDDLRTFDEHIQYLSDNQLPPFGPKEEL